jgi:transcriptional regulator with XRE-family HTH domain
MRKSLRTASQKRLQELLRTVREERGILQADLAVRLGKPQSFVSKVETGERRLDLPELEQVCEGIGISLEEFVKRFLAQRSREEK